MTTLPLQLLPLLLLLLPPLTTTTTTTATKPPQPCIVANRPPTTTTTTTAANGVTNFGLRLFQLFGTTSDATLRATNILISPYSLWVVLTLAYIGAEGNTAEQLAAVLGWQSKEGAFTLLTGYQNSLLNITKSDNRISFDSATRLYVDDRQSIARCREELADYLVKLNLASQPEQAASTINKYVNATTRGLIPTIISPSLLDSTSRLVAISAVYFKGMWRYPFDLARTERKPFYPLGSTKENVTVDMMVVNDALVRIGYPQELHAQAIQLPYSSGLVNMTILLPSDRSAAGFRKTVRALSASTFKNALDSLEEDFVDIKLPKFEVKTELAEEMIKALKTLGIKDLFSQRLANLSSFSEDLYVKHLVHKTVIKVDEEGTEAAGATAAVFVTKIRKSVDINRSFIYAIHDIGTIFFIGIFIKP